MKYLIGIDVGTSGTKTVLFDLKGREISSATYDYPLYQNGAGRAEQEPEDWAVAAEKGIADVIAAVDAKEVAAVGISGQMHGLVMLDEQGKVIRRSIIWCDQRTAKQAEYANNTLGRERLMEWTANPAVAGFTAYKLLWVKENEPQNYLRCHHVLLPKDYVRYRLTDVLATEVSDASGTGLLNVRGRKWSKEACAALDIDTSLLPQLFESSDIVGRITEEAAKRTGLPVGVPVVGGAGDQAAAAVGNGVVEEGIVSDTLGSSGVVFACTDKPITDEHGVLHAFCHAVRGKWHVMGVTQGFGLSIQWARNNLAMDLSYAEMDRLAESVSSDGLLFLPYLMGERCPHADSNARGVFFGLANTHGRAQLIRAVMEGACFSQLDCLNLLRSIGIKPREIRVGGGAAKSSFIRQMLADMFGEDVYTVGGAECGALGAAILAGVGVGIYESVEDACAECVRSKMSCISGRNDRYKTDYARYRTLYEAVKPIF